MPTRAHLLLSTSNIVLALGFAFATLPMKVALASDGVLEINQACAVNTGCFSGDTPGFPVTIDGGAGKSYQLTSSLTLPDGNTTGIELTSTVSLSASGTTIDLNGFTIGCFPGVCTPGSGGGIQASLAPPVPTTTVRVRNGTVQGVGLDGILLGTLSVVEDVTAIGNRAHGISVGEHSTVVRSRALQNGSNGITAGAGATISDSSASLNTSSGIHADSGSTITNVTTNQNGLAGIDVTGGCNVRGSTARGNAYAGMDLGGTSAYSGNVVTNNTIGQVVGTGGTLGNRGGNYCFGTGTVSADCP